jgi:hypothetical protein
MARGERSKQKLSRYVKAVAATWAGVLIIAWRVGGLPRLESTAILASGFFLGMLAMYIAVHVYDWQ